MTKEYILNFLRTNKKLLKEKYQVSKIGLFGSYARDEAKDSSDIDIAVELKSKNSFRSFFSLLYFLENSFEKKVDLGIESSLKPLAKKKILQEIIYV
jgi:predicted nucleotidyltransferase